MKKITLGTKIMDVIEPEEYYRLSQLENPILDDTCIELNGMVYPIQKRYDGSPGVYDGGGFMKYTKPVVNQEDFMSSNIIDFNKAESFADMIKTQDKFKRCEEAILTTKDNISKFPLRETDQPELTLMKEVVNAKNIDLDDYGGRLGSDKNNAFRPLKDKNNDNISFYRAKTLCNVLDVRMIIRIEDKPGAVNPMGIVIEKELTMGD